MMDMRLRRGWEVSEIGGITFVKSDCRCTSCQYIMHIEKRNEQEDGSYDLKIWCQLANCPNGGDMIDGEV